MQKFLDYEGLAHYDKKIKEEIDNAKKRGVHSVELDPSTYTLNIKLMDNSIESVDLSSLPFVKESEMN